MIKKTMVIGIALCGILWAAFVALKPDPEFSFQLVAPSTLSHEAWNMRPLSFDEQREMKTILSQKFSYIGCGNQSYVFFSDDGSSVLKLFKKKRFEAPAWIQLLPPLRYKMKKVAAKRANLYKDFTSYQIAFNELQDETGLICVHLNPTPVVDQTVTLVDHLKRPYQVHLNDYAFILQKRGELVGSALDHLVRQGNISAAKEALSSLLHLLKDRCDKGVADRDPNLGKNFAFIGHQAVQIDIGRFSHTGVTIPKISQDFKAQLHRLSPELLDHFEQEYHSIFKQ